MDDLAHGIDSLIDVVVSCIASDQWVENGGAEAEIRPIQPGLLVVSATTDMHRQIRGLLQSLRQARQHSYAVPHTNGGGPAGGMRGGGQF